MKLKQNFSEIYHSLIPELIDIEVPEEKWADCHNCHHCTSPQKERHLTKCCDYQPSLPNFIIGAILSDQSPALKGPQVTIRNKIANKKGVTPFGIAPSIGYQRSLKEDRAKNSGLKTSDSHRTSLLCHFYDSGMCTIHKYRADICGNFFCYSVSSIEGKRLSKVVQSFSQSIDYILSVYIAKEASIEFGKIPNLELLKDTATLLENDEGSLKSNYKNLWGNWANKEEEYYKKCYHLIENMTAEKVNSILGNLLTTSTEEIQLASKTAYQNRTPDKLFFNSKRYDEWLKRKETSIQENSLELFLLKLFNGKRDSGEVVLKAVNFDKHFNFKLSEFVRNGILSQEEPQ